MITANKISERFPISQKKVQSIEEYEEIIVRSVHENSVTIIEGATACGKSSKIPIFLAKAGYRVIITEQKRLNCVFLAKRVANTFGKQPVGQIVGCNTFFSKSFSDDSKIIFSTEATELLRLLNNVENLENTVLIIDEVHESTLYSDLLIAISKKLLDSGSSIKVILMSATLNRKELSNYYNNAHIIKVASKSYYISTWNFPSKELTERVSFTAQKHQNILVFLSGKQEICALEKSISKNVDTTKCELLRLHSEMDYEEQQKIFKFYPHPKVILSTNISQTSLNIYDLDYVIDTGLEKRLEYHNNIPILCLHNISKASCKQRKGRIGRFGPGNYCLCSDFPYEDREEFITPEIYYTDLTDALLMLKSANIDITSLTFLHRPKSQQIAYAERNLRMLGAIDENGEITEVGLSMAKIPLDARSARMLVEAQKYNVEFDVLICSLLLHIGSICNDMSAIPNNLQNKGSDLFTELNVFKCLYYTSKNSHNKFKSLLGKYYIRYSTYNNILETLSVLVKRFHINTDKKPIDEKSIKRCLLVNTDYLFINVGRGYRNSTISSRYFANSYSLIDKSSTCIFGYPYGFSEIPDSLSEVRHRINLPTIFTADELFEFVPELFTKNYFLTDGILYANLFYNDLKAGFAEIGKLYDLLEEEPENFREETEHYSLFDSPSVSLYYCNCKISTTIKTE